MGTIRSVVAAWGLCLAGVALGGVQVKSPSGRLTLDVSVDAGQLQYAVRLDDRPIIEPSKLGITVDGKDLGASADMGAAQVVAGKDQFRVIGGHTAANVAFADVSVPVQSGSPAAAWTLQCRVYDGAVAYRYRFPGDGKRHIDREAGEWRLPAQSQAWFEHHDGWKAYEARCETASLAQLKRDDPLTAPLLVRLGGDGPYAVITEANLVHYTDMGLRHLGEGLLKVDFPNDGKGFDLDGEIVSPWRVVLVSPDLNGLVNSDVIESLCPPPAPELAGADWIRPGRAAWHWRVTGHPKFADQRQWVDWAAALGFEYYLVDDGWKDWKESDRNAWAMLKDVADYGRSKHVATIAWVDSKYVFKPEDRRAYFAKAQAAGLAGLKIDFPHPANREWVDWYDDTLRDAAAAKLIVDFHGAVKPTGRERNWPNELNREAIGGREQGTLPGLHDATLPFLRFVQGHADYTPLETRQSELKGNTVAKELAQAIVYTSPLLCYSGPPADYLASPAADVIRSIPPVWDETIVLPGSSVGAVAAFARRSGETWYVGIINGDEPRTLQLKLSFLGSGKYDAVLLGDTPNQPAQFDRHEATHEAGDLLDISMSHGGGFVARFTPANQ